MSAAKNWCFTINNYHDDDIQKLETMFDHGHFNYIIFGQEVGQNETPHLQGYVQMKRKMRLNQVKKFISPRAHLEVAGGNPEQNRRYKIMTMESDFTGIVVKTVNLKS